MTDTMGLFHEMVRVSNGASGGAFSTRFVVQIDGLPIEKRGRTKRPRLKSQSFTYTGN